MPGCYLRMSCWSQADWEKLVDHAEAHMFKGMQQTYMLPLTLNAALAAASVLIIVSLHLQGASSAIYAARQ